MSFSDEIKNRLSGLGVPSPILTGSKIVEPESGSFVHIREYPGRAPVKVHNTGAATRYARPALQCIAHASNKVDSRTLAYQVYNGLSFVNATLGTTWYVQVSPIQEPYDFGLDSKGRVKFAFNVETLKTPS